MQNTVRHQRKPKVLTVGNPLRLSFVRDAIRTGRDHWAVETSGDYSEDYRRGEALGQEFITFVGDAPTNGSLTLLGAIHEDMIAKAIATNGAGKGLRLGFLRTVNAYAMAAATLAGKAA